MDSQIKVFGQHHAIEYWEMVESPIYQDNALERSPQLPLFNKK